MLEQPPTPDVPQSPAETDVLGHPKPDINPVPPPDIPPQPLPDHPDPQRNALGWR